MGYSIVKHSLAMIPDRQCCFVSEDGQRCEQESLFWVGCTFLDYSYSCGDHAEDIRGQHDSVIRMSDGLAITKQENK